MPEWNELYETAGFPNFRVNDSFLKENFPPVKRCEFLLKNHQLFGNG